MNIELIVFDMAGTTINEQNVVYKTIHQTLSQHQINVTLEEVLELAGGKEKMNAIRDIIEKYDLNKAVEVNQIFDDFKQNLISAYETLDIIACSGMLELIKFLRENNIKIALNTGFDSYTAQLTLDKLHWKKGEHYDALTTADDVLQSRPHPDMILKSMELLHITQPEKVMKVGDTAIDIYEGKNANCGITVGILFGAQNRAQLTSASPDYIIENLLQIKNIILK